MSDPIRVSHNHLRNLLQQLLIRYVPPAELTYTTDPLLLECRRVLAQFSCFEMPPIATWGP